MNKALCTLIWILCIALGAACDVAAQCILHVKVISLPMGNPINGIEVSAAGISADLSDDKGYVQLYFKNRQPGDQVTLVVSNTGDLLLVNRKETESIIIPAERQDTIQILLAKPSHFSQALSQHYRFSSAQTQGPIHARTDSLLALLKVSNDEQEKALLRARLTQIALDTISAPFSNPRGQIHTADDSIFVVMLQQRLDSANKAIEAVLAGYRLKAHLYWKECQFQQIFDCTGRWITIRKTHSPGTPSMDYHMYAMHALACFVLERPKEADASLNVFKEVSSKGKNTFTEADWAALLDQQCISEEQRHILYPKIRGFLSD